MRNSSSLSSRIMRPYPVGSGCSAVNTDAANFPSLCAATNCANESPDSSGVSPAKTRTVPLGAVPASANCAACPVPPRCSWKTVVALGAICPICASTASRP